MSKTTSWQNLWFTLKIPKIYELTAKLTAVKFFSHHHDLATQVSEEVPIQIHARTYIHTISEISQ